MEAGRFLACLEDDFRQLRAVAQRTDLMATVPSCPEWTLEQLVRHVGTVYLHKVECMRLNAKPDPWPPPALASEDPLRLLDRSYEALAAEFQSHRPDDPAFTWYDPDQSVRFWIRRMAQETVIHRADAELAAGEDVSHIPDDLAEDGIDELLVAFVEYGTTGWPDEFEEILASARRRTVGVVAPERSWLVRLDPDRVRVDGAPSAPDATVIGPAPDLLLWLWNRGGQATKVSGDDEVVGLFREILVESSQ